MLITLFYVKILLKTFKKSVFVKIEHFLLKIVNIILQGYQQIFLSLFFDF